MDKTSGTSIHGTVLSSVENLLLISFFFFSRSRLGVAFADIKKSYSSIKSENGELGKLGKTAFSHGS